MYERRAPFEELMEFFSPRSPPTTLFLLPPNPEDEANIDEIFNIIQ